MKSSTTFDRLTHLLPPAAPVTRFSGKITSNRVVEGFGMPFSRIKRIRAKLGAIPMGATLWDPCYRPDRRDLAIQGAVRRAGEALASSREGAGEVAWKLAVYGPGDRADEEDPW